MTPHHKECHEAFQDLLAAAKDYAADSTLMLPFQRFVAAANKWHSMRSLVAAEYEVNRARELYSKLMPQGEQLND